MLFKYSFIDLVGNKYLVELKNIPVSKVGKLSNVYELLYFVEDEGLRFVLYQLMYPLKFQKSMLGDSFKELIPYWIFLPMQDIIYVMRTHKMNKTVIVDGWYHL